MNPTALITSALILIGGVFLVASFLYRRGGTGQAVRDFGIARPGDDEDIVNDDGYIPNDNELPWTVLGRDKDDPETILKKSGNPFGWTVEEYESALNKRSLIIAAVVGGVILALGLAMNSFEFILAGAVAGFCTWIIMKARFPEYLIGVGRVRTAKCLDDLPILMNYIYAFLPVSGVVETAWRNAVKELPRGILKSECEYVLMLVDKNQYPFGEAQDAFADRFSNCESLRGFAHMIKVNAKLNTPDTLSATLLKNRDVIMEEAETMKRLIRSDVKRTIETKIMMSAAAVGLVCGVFIPFGVNMSEQFSKIGGN